MKMLLMLLALGLAAPAFAESQVGKDLSKTTHDTGQSIQHTARKTKAKTRRHARHARVRAHRTFNAISH